MDKFNEYKGLDPFAVQSVLEEQKLLKFTDNLLATDKFSVEEHDKVSSLIVKLHSERDKYLYENMELKLQIKILFDKIKNPDKDIDKIISATIKEDVEKLSNILEINTNSFKEEISDKNKQINILMDLAINKNKV